MPHNNHYYDIKREPLYLSFMAKISYFYNYYKFLIYVLCLVYYEMSFVMSCLILAKGPMRNDLRFAWNSHTFSRAFKSCSLGSHHRHHHLTNAQGIVVDHMRSLNQNFLQLCAIAHYSSRSVKEIALNFIL